VARAARRARPAAPPPPAAGGASTTEGPPVSLAGTVNNHGTTTLSSGDITIQAEDFFFSPTFVKATAGATVAIDFENEGKNQHTFTIDSLSVDKEVAPGQEVTINLRLPAGGTVTWYCRFHKNSGMQGAFVVPGSSGSGPATTTPAPSPQGSYP